MSDKLVATLAFLLIFTYMAYGDTIKYLDVDGSTKTVKISGRQICDQHCLYFVENHQFLYWDSKKKQAVYEDFFCVKCNHCDYRIDFKNLPKGASKKHIKDVYEVKEIWGWR